MKKPVPEQVILVTGASSGLGRAVARLAGERGARVVVTARGTDGLDACVREIESFGLQALASSAARSPRPQDPLKQARPGPSTDDPPLEWRGKFVRGESPANSRKTIRL